MLKSPCDNMFAADIRRRQHSPHLGSKETVLMKSIVTVASKAAYDEELSKRLGSRGTKQRQTEL